MASCERPAATGSAPDVRPAEVSRLEHRITIDAQGVARLGDELLPADDEPLKRRFHELGRTAPKKHYDPGDTSSPIVAAPSMTFVADPRALASDVLRVVIVPPTPWAWPDRRIVDTRQGRAARVIRTPFLPDWQGMHNPIHYRVKGNPSPGRAELRVAAFSAALSTVDESFEWRLEQLPPNDGFESFDFDDLEALLPVLEVRREFWGQLYLSRRLPSDARWSEVLDFLETMESLGAASYVFWG